jgi:hypothetical protein
MAQNKSIPAYPHNAARCVATLFRLRDAPSELDRVLALAQQSALNNAPCNLQDLFFVPEQISVVPAVLFPKPRSSLLFQYLKECPDAFHLITDAFKTGKEALYLCRLSTDRNEVSRWLSRMYTPCMLVNSVEGELVIAAPLHSFVA